jgi:Mg-chelatase subunit ChlI
MKLKAVAELLPTCTMVAACPFQATPATAAAASQNREMSTGTAHGALPLHVDLFAKC